MDSTQRTGLIVAAGVIVVVTAVMTLTVARHTGGSASAGTTTTTESSDDGDGSSTTSGTTGEFIRRPVQLDPRTGLRDGDVVDVTSNGFAPDETVELALCASPAPGERLAPGACDDATSNLTSADSDGTVATQFTVKAEADTEDLGTIECRSTREACAIAVRSYDDAERVGVAAITFDESVLPPPDARIAVDPVDALTDGQTVTVTGRNFTRKDNVEVRECPAEAHAGLCWTVSGGDARVEDDGTFSVTVPVWRLLDGDPGVPVDCAAATGACVLEAGGSDNAEPVALTFDPAGPLPVIPTVTVTPSDGLSDEQVVAVHGEGFIPGLGLLLEQSAVTAGGDQCFIFFNSTTGDDPQVRAGADGTFDGTLRLDRRLHGERVIDCAVPGTCVVLAEPYSYSDDIIQHASLTPAGVPITFRS